jgi:prevent-host-death family protein
MSITVNATDANQRFAELLGKVAAGETVIITKRGEPVAQLTSYRPEAASPARKAAWDKLIARLGSVPMPAGGFVWNRDELYGDREVKALGKRGR